MASAEDPSGELGGGIDPLIGIPSPGELVLKKLFAQFFVCSQTKLNHISRQPLANPLSKYLQRGEDLTFDQLLLSLRDVASFCLRSLLIALNDWRKRFIKQIKTSQRGPFMSSSETLEGLSKKEQEYFIERLELAVEFIYCMTLVEVLQKLPVHPVPEPFIHDIEALAFHHFRAQEPLKERSTNNPNVANAKRVADLYAEVIGVVSQVRFLSVRMRFFAELKNPQNSTSVIISVIEGLSFVRVKMYPVEELEEWFSFLQECANYMLEDAKGEKVKHAMSTLLVDILTPVAAVIKYEMSMPAVRKLVSTLYSHFYDQSKKLRHSTAYIPLITILLAIGEDRFFLNNWHTFVTQQVLQNLRRGDAKLQRVALDSLYRLLWVYMIRIKAEGNVTTYNRLRPIVDTLFPRAGGRGIQLKDFPPNIFVKIIYFIARERVDNAMNDIVIELVTKHRGGVNPERVIIGLRAFLMIADSLEKKDGDPPMPLAFSTMQSGSITRTKTKFLTSTLTEKIAKKIGVMKYYQPIRRALSNILKQLDISVGNLVSTNLSASKAPEESLGGERKPKLDLLKTCVAAIPRIMPEGMTKTAVVELLSRLTIHLDNDLSRMAITALQNIVSNYADWRTDILRGYAAFILQEIPDSCPLVLEGALKILGQLLGHWRSLVTASGQEELDLSNPPGDSIVWVESCALVTFCSYRSLTRKYSLAILKEVRALLEVFRQIKEKKQLNVMDIMEKATPGIIKSYLSTLSPKERTELRTHQHLNLWWLADRSACFLEVSGGRSTLRDAWSQCIVGLLEPSVLPAQCTRAVQLTWPYILQRMLKAYYIVNPGSASERPDKLPTLRNPRGGYVSQPELFLWRSYLFFACSIAPPSSSPMNHIGIQEAKQVFGEKYTAKDLFKIVLPLIRSEDEIGEVFVSALGLANPAAFQDLIESLKPWVGDSLDLRKSDTFKKRRRRDNERVHITRIFALAAENECFKVCPGILNKDGELCSSILHFIEGVKQYLENDTDRFSTPTTELHLHYSTLIANIINSFVDDPAQLKLFTRETRYSLFYLVAGWSGPYWHHHNTDIQEEEERLVKQARSNFFLYNVLHAMSALLCCGPVFEQEALRGGRYIYRWLENMLCSQEVKIQQLGRKTVQLLLQNNKEPFLLNWVLDHCYSSRSNCAALCFHALSSTFAKIPTYPCKMISVLHVILYKTASLDHQTRERAMQLLHILDKRFFVSGEVGSRRPELLGLITGSIFSNLHVPVSEELAFANPELTLPLFCEMIQRFENTPPYGRKSILQIMKPWLRNVELVEESTKVLLPQAHVLKNNILSVVTEKTSNPVLSDSGWGSLEGTYLVLHNLLYLTAKYGDEYMPEIESLWCALCSWPTNIRVTLNYLARLTCVAGNLSLMLQQAKRVIVYFSHKNSKITITELMREVQCVELITAEVHPNEAPPFYRLSSRSVDNQGQLSGDQLAWQENEGESWATKWRIEVRTNEGQPIPLPIPTNMRFFASMKDILRIPCRHINMHRSNFALILLSEVVPEVNDFDWAAQLPVLLHVMTLGLDFHRPVVYEHSKKLLGNLVVLLACREDYTAACEARLTQYDMFMHSSSVISLSGQEDSELERYGSVCSIAKRQGIVQTSLAQRVHDLIQFVSIREGRKVCWPFQDHSSRSFDLFAKPSDLTTLIEQILSAFQNCSADSLLEKWTRVALSWATSCSSQQFASQSFQICRALKIPLDTTMLREVLTRLAESASDQSDELQNYVLEIFLTLENAVDNTKDTVLHPSHIYPDHPRQISDVTPVISCDESSPKKLVHSISDGTDETARVPDIHVHVPTGRPPLPMTSTSMIHKPSSFTSKDIPLPTSISVTGPPADPPITKSLPAAVMGHKKRHSRGHSVTKIEIPVDINENSPIIVNSPLEKNEVHVHVHAVGENPTSKLTSASSGNVQNESNLDVIETSSSSSLTRPQSAGGRLDISHGNPISAVNTKPPTPLAVVAREIVTRESTPRKVSGPPIRLLNLFAPLKSVTSPPKLSIDANQPQLQRPMSMIVSSNSELTNTIPVTSSIVPSATISESLSTLGESFPSSTDSVSSPNILSKSSVLNEQDEDDSMEREEDIEQEILLPRELDIHVKKEEIFESEINKDKDDIQDQSPKQESLNSRSHNTSFSSEGSDNVNIIRVPSHPDLRHRPHLSKVDSLDSSPIIRARSVSQLQNEIDGESGSFKRRAYSGSRETVPGFAGLLKENSHIRRSLDKLRGKGSTVPLLTSRLPLSHQNSPNKSDKERISRRVSADPERDRERVLSAGSKGRGRPRSMIETGSFVHYRNPSMDFTLSASQDFLSQLFWTSVSLLESDYENEYFLAQHLFGKVISHFDLMAESTYSRLEMILQTTKSEKFVGVHRLLLKGLTLESTTKSTRELLSKVCPHVNRSIFDPSNFKGLPLNIMALLPELMLNFEKPTDTSKDIAETVSKSCTIAIPQAHNSELMTVLKDMGHLFHLYSIGDFSNTRAIWLKSVCHYLCNGYVSVLEELLKLLSKMLEFGSDTYHQPVLWIIHEFLVKLEDCGSVNLDLLIEIITRPVSSFIKGPLWQDALVVLMRAIKNSSSLVQPPNSHIAVMELGIFHQTLPGPTLNFEMDLASSSEDIKLAHDIQKPTQWQRPQASQRVTRERLSTVISASGPIPVLFSSPSVIFNDEQTLIGSYMDSSEEEDEIEDIVEEDEEEMQVSSTKASTEVLDNSQPESVLINSIGETFDFLNNYQYSDEDEQDDTKNIEGPFSSGREKTYSSSLTSSISSLVSDDEEEDHSIVEHDNEHHDIPLLDDDTVETLGTFSSLTSITDHSLSPVIPVSPLERSVSPTKLPASPPLASVHFSGLEDSGMTSNSADSQVNFDLPEQFEDHDIDEEYEDEEIVGIDEDDPYLDFAEEGDNASEIFLDKETIFDINITTQIFKPESNKSEDTSVEDTYNDDSFTKSSSPSHNSETENGKDLISDSYYSEVYSEAIKNNELIKESEIPQFDSDEKENSSSMDIKVVDEEHVVDDEAVSNKDDRMEKTNDSLAQHLSGTELKCDSDNEDQGEVNETINETHLSDDPADPSVVQYFNNTDTEPHNIELQHETTESTEPQHETTESTEPQHETTKNTEPQHETTESTEPQHETTKSTEPQYETTESINQDQAAIDDKHTSMEEYIKQDPLPYRMEDLVGLSDDDDDVYDNVSMSEISLSSHRVDAHRAAHFISIADEEVEEMWTDHVSNLSRSKSPSQAVNTFYLFYRLFTVYRKQICMLTEQAYNYMADGFWDVSTNCLVTAELMKSELNLPLVYLDTDAVSKTGILEKFVSLVLEMHTNSENLKASRQLALDNIKKCKVIFQSGDSAYELCLNLCHSIQQLHYYLLIFVSTYTKLISVLTEAISKFELLSIGPKLTDIQKSLEKAISQRSRNYDIPDSETSLLLASMTDIQGLRYLQELIASHQVQKALSVLHLMRSRYRDEHLFGSGQADDVDVLVFAFTHFIAEGQEGIVGITIDECSLSDRLSRLMSQNVSLLSLLEKHRIGSSSNDQLMLSSET